MRAQLFENEDIVNVLILVVMEEGQRRLVS